MSREPFVSRDKQKGPWSQEWGRGSLQKALFLNLFSPPHFPINNDQSLIQNNGARVQFVTV